MYNFVLCVALMNYIIPIKISTIVMQLTEASTRIFYHHLKQLQNINISSRGEN